MTVRAEALPSLFRRFMAASLMRSYFEKSLKDEEKQPSRDPFLFLSTRTGIFMAYWCGALYVVIEGWQKLGLHDPEVDHLLNSPNVSLLKRFRNGVFHFQKKWLDSRVTGFMASRDSVPWVRKLTAAFRRALMAAMKARYGSARA